MHSVKICVGILIASVLFQTPAFAQLSNKQVKAIRSLMRPGSPMQVSVLDPTDPKSDHSIAFIGIDYQNLKRSELLGLGLAMERFNEVYVQSADLKTPIRSKIGARAASHGVMLMGDLPSNWFRSYIYPCSTLFSAAATAVSTAMLCVYPDVHQIILTTGASALTYLNYKMWKNQELRYLSLKLKVFARALDQAEGQTLLVTDAVTAGLVRDILLRTQEYSLKDLKDLKDIKLEEPKQPQDNPENNTHTPVLTAEEIEKEKLRQQEEDEQERQQTEKYIAALEEEAKLKKSRESAEAERQRNARIIDEWEKAQQRREREERRASRTKKK